MIKNQGTTIRKQSKALVYPADTVSGYGHIFSLGIADIHVVALSPQYCASFKSRYVKEKYLVPDPLNNHEAFVSWLIDYGKKQQNKPVLFLVEDVFAYIVSLYQDELAPYCLYPYIPHDKLDIFFNKKAMFKEAAKTNIVLPFTLFSPLVNEDVSNWNQFPAVMKPLVSRFTFADRRLVDAVKFPILFGGKAIQVSNKQELQYFALKLEQENVEYCIQKLIPGENSNIANIKFVSTQDGIIPSCFISRKIRQQPADFGTCCVSQSEYIKCIHEYAEKFCRWYFIEINPRLDYWISMSTLKGVNLPLQLYFLSTSQRLFVHKQLDNGRYWIDIPGDLKGLKWRRKHKEWSLSIRNFLRPYAYFNEAIFTIRDPLPGLIRLFKVSPFVIPLHRLKSLVRSLCYIFMKKVPLQEFSKYDQYWEKRRFIGTANVVYPRFLKAMEFIKSEFSILDYGCGSGEFLRFLRTAGYKNLYGTDVCKPVDFPKGIEFKQIDQLTQKLQFDAITLLQVAEHVQDAEQLIKRLLKLTDWLIISIPNTGYWHHRMRLLFGRMPITDVVFHMKEHVRFWTKRDFIEMCKQKNWKIERLVATEPARSYLAKWMPGFFARQIMYVLSAHNE
jgi:methionine biosynthesis protein MetW